jgi:hypothetical protein
MFFDPILVNSMEAGLINLDNLAEKWFICHLAS